MKDLLNFGQMLSAHARVTPSRVGARDLERSMTFTQWNERSCRLANALLGLGLDKGDRVAHARLQLRRVVEIYAATAKAGSRRGADQFPPGRQGNRSTSSTMARRARSSCRTNWSAWSRRSASDLADPARTASSISARSACPAGYRAYEDYPAAGERPRASADRRPVRPVDADVHVRHHRQAQGRGAQPPQRACCCRWSRRSSWVCTATTARSW